jgi:hypothetical protein
MGNSRWRLQTALNYLADQVESLGRASDVEVIVADWGSEVPLREVIQLSAVASRIVSFMLVPPEIARSVQKDSPFPEVLALNAAARRAHGRYIGRIDQDTLVGRHFLEVLFEFVSGIRRLEVPLSRALLYSNRRTIPYWFAVLCPAYDHVVKYLQHERSACVMKAKSANWDFWTYWVGIWLIHRELWTDCGGYDERFIYYNWMEVEMISRLRQRYELIDFGKLVDYDFYHLDHVNPRPRIFPSRAKRGGMSGRPNNHFRLDISAASLPFSPNGDDWGLAAFHFDLEQGLATLPSGKRKFDHLIFLSLILRTRLQLMVDRCLGRTRRVMEVLREEKPKRWIPVLRSLWSERGRHRR